MSQKLALVIGNSEYQDPALARLKAPDADVRALTDLLRDPDIGQFDDVLALVNEPEAKTRRAIASFFVRARPDDVLLLYFSGHGLMDDKGRLYLAAQDTQRDLPQATAISAAFVTDAMDSSRSRQQLLILDCCHSGAFARGARSAGDDKAITQATFEGVGSGRVVLTATDATQYAWEGETVIGSAENSVFTHFMIQGLKTGAADTDGDGQVTLEELYTYLYSEVVKQTPKQTPRKWSYNQQGEFVIARNPHPGTAKPLPLPDDLQHSLEDLRPWVREGTARELERLLFGGVPGLAVAAHAGLLKLKDDDSHRVSLAASDILARYEAKRSAQEVERQAAHLQAERARESAKAERLAAEQAERARGAAKADARTPIPAAAQPATSPPVAQLVEPAGVAGDTERPPALSARPLTPPSSLDRVMGSPLAGRLLQDTWLPFLMIALGWGATRGLAEIPPSELPPFYLVWFVNWTIGGAVGGLITGLALRRFEPRFGWNPIWRLAGGWAGAWAVGWLVTVTLGKFRSDFGLTVPDELLGVMGPVITGALGGYFLGAIWRAVQPKLRDRQVWRLAAGWSASWGLGSIVVALVHNDRGWPVAWSLGGLVAGLLGGWLVLWQAREARASETTAAAPPLAGPSSSAVTLTALWLPLGLTALGWAGARLVGHGLSLLGETVMPVDTVSNLLDFASWVLGGALGGWLTGVALRRVEPALGKKGLWKVAGAWAASWAFAWMLTVAIWIFVNEQSLIVAPHLPSTLSLAIGGAVGGYLTVVIWNELFPAVYQRKALLVAGGWALGLGLGNLLRYGILDALNGTDVAWLAGWGLGGLVAGIIGAAVMFWQFTRRGRAA